MNTTTRTNRHPANCANCGVRVPAGEGNLTHAGNAWVVTHPTCPPKPIHAAEPTLRATQDGIYRTADGTIYKVQQARGGGHLYAKRLAVTTCTDTACGHPTLIADDGTHAHGHFEYAPGAFHTLTASQRLERADAAAFGRLYGICCACGADLTDETSIAAGLGPICGKRF